MSETKTPALPDAPRVIFINKVESGRHQDDLGLLPTFLVNKQAGGLVQSEAREREDEFHAINTQSPEAATIAPHFDPRVLSRLAWRNNILPPLIEAMEVNIDGTGAEIVPREDVISKTPTQGEQESGTLSPELQKQKEGLEAWFAEPWPGESFLTIRRKMRRDQEENGNAYLEILRSVDDEVMFARHIDAKTIRLVKLGPAVLAKKRVMRRGKEVTTEVFVRERRFAQIIAGKPVYFKEFGASRDLNRNTGMWAGDEDSNSQRDPEAPKAATDDRLPPTIRATEILHFGNKPDPESPYSIPRWISNVPSVVGSRRAEEFNLDFFDAGGVPPLMIIVQGGALAEDAEKALREHFMSSGAARHQAAVMEAFSTSGDINSSQNVRVTVERFGADRQKDSMFETYIKNSDARTGRSFRLPNMFLGVSEGMTFATAFVSYTVAEAQAFKPERDEFDEIINLRLMSALPGGENFWYRSRPVVAVGAERQLEAMALVKDMVEPFELVEEVNQIANITLKVRSKEDIEKERERQADRLAQTPLDRRESEATEPGTEKGRRDGAGNVPARNESSRSRPVTQNKAELRGLQVLAEDMAVQMARGVSDDEQLEHIRHRLAEVDTLHPSQMETFKRHLAYMLFTGTEVDPEGAVALAEGLLRQFAAKFGD